MRVSCSKQNNDLGQTTLAGMHGTQACRVDDFDLIVDLRYSFKIPQSRLQRLFEMKCRQLSSQRQHAVSAAIGKSCEIESVRAALAGPPPGCLFNRVFDDWFCDLEHCA